MDRFPDRERFDLIHAFPDHRPWPRPHMFFGGVHGAYVGSAGEFTGVGDARRDGVAIVVD